MPPLGTQKNNAAGLWRRGKFQQKSYWSSLLCWKNMLPLGTRKNNAIRLWPHCKSLGFLTNKRTRRLASPIAEGTAATSREKIADNNRPGCHASRQNDYRASDANGRCFCC